MRLAWFAPTPDDVALELGRQHHVDLYDAGRAHDFVWRNFRAPYDLTIFELADSPAHAYIWAYLFHDPGILVLRATSVQQSRTETLTLHHRRHHLRAERAFAGASLLRAPLAAARLVIVHDDATARELQDEYPTIDFRVLPIGVSAPAVTASDGEIRFRHVTPRPDLVERAASRARNRGARIETSPGLHDLHDRDVVIALEWPPTGAAPRDALRAMAAGLPAIVFETEAVAAWPTLDPQTWQPRGYVPGGRPIAVSIDPRDEEHSLMLAMHRLSGDQALRAQLGHAARAWAGEHASAVTAAPGWEAALADAAGRTPPRAPADLPPHLLEDGTAAARTVLREFGITLDVPGS